jgi:hypothetical protein
LLLRWLLTIGFFRELFGNQHLSPTTEISGNTAQSNGGGVYLQNPDSFRKKGGGIIYGYTSGDPLSNTAINGYAHAIFKSSTQYKATTVGPGENLTYQ